MERLSARTIGMILVSGLLMAWSIMYVFGIYTYPTFPLIIINLNLPSLGIVIGGLIISTMISYPAALAWDAFRNVFALFSQSTIDSNMLRRDIDRMIEWLHMFRNDRKSAVQELQKRHRNDFEGYLISLLNTNYTTDDISELADKQIASAYEKRLEVSRVFQSMGNTAPAFGMLGTLLGLIVMLRGFEDAAQLGQGLSLALMTTLYGLAFAHFIFFPLALKIRITAEKQMYREMMIKEAVLMIHQNKPPMILKDQLLTYLNRDYSYA